MFIVVDSLDRDNLYVWAMALKELGKIEIAMKKTEEAIQIGSSEKKGLPVCTCQKLIILAKYKNTIMSCQVIMIFTQILMCTR